MIHQVIAFILLILVYIFSNSAFAKDQCEARMIRVSSVRVFEEFNPYPPVKFESNVPFELGGVLRTARRSGYSWHSSFAEVDRAPEADPRLFVLIFGSRTAHFFGYRSLAEDLITVPSAEAFNRSIEFLNGNELKDNSISIRFYDAEGIVDDKMFLKRLLNFELPLANGSHDHAFHAGLLEIPEEDFKFVMSQVKQAMDFLEWVEPRLKDRAWFNGLNRTLIEFLITIADVSFGNTVGNTAIRSILNISTSDPQFLEKARPDFVRLFSRGLSPEQFLKNEVLQVFDVLVQSGFKIEPREKITLNNLIAEFNTQHPAPHGRQGLQDTKENLVSFLKRINTRRGQIAKAVVEAQTRMKLSLPK